MNLRLNFDETSLMAARIKVVGVGGAGCNAVNRMIDAGLRGVDFVAMNTDMQALETSKSSLRLQIGKTTTRGLGAGADPEIAVKPSKKIARPWRMRWKKATWCSSPPAWAVAPAPAPRRSWRRLPKISAR
jgi:hypothetical protein